MRLWSHGPSLTPTPILWETGKTKRNAYNFDSIFAVISIQHFHPFYENGGKIFLSKKIEKEIWATQVQLCSKEIFRSLESFQDN